MAFQFSTKAQWVHMSISSQSDPKGLERLRYSKYDKLKIGKYSHFEAESCQKYRLYGKKFRIKVFRISVSYQQLSGAHMSVSSQSGPRGLLSSQIRYTKNSFEKYRKYRYFMIYYRYKTIYR